MADYTLTKKAVQDLKQIWNYSYDNWSEQQADKYYNEIIGHCKSVAKNPQSGIHYDILLSGLKGSRVNKHILFYRQLSKDLIEVERILHERMDLKTRLWDD